MMKGILIVLLVLLLGNVILLYLLAPRLSGRRRVHPFFGVKWAHRGLHDIKKGIPENSIPAFQAAIEAGYGIELDVHLTKDGKLVVFHDDDFRRICGEKGKVEETDYARMRTYRLSRTGEKIPLLSEVLRLVDGKVPLLIEVKLPSADTEVCRRLDEELQGYRGKYMVQSFNSLVLRWMKKHRNEIPRGQLSENLTRKPDTTHYALRFCVKYLLSNCMCRPDFISYKWADRKNPGFLVNKKLFHAPVAAWTLHGEKDLRAAKRSFDNDSRFQVYYTRTADTYPSLSQRANLANNRDADMFLCVHINSASASARGTETLWSKGRNSATKKNGLTSKELATAMQDAAVDVTGFKDRGLVDRPNLYVLRHTKMPACLIEYGFISNKTEAARMKANTSVYGKALYNAVVNLMKKEGRY